MQAKQRGKAEVQRLESAQKLTKHQLNRKHEYGLERHKLRHGQKCLFMSSLLGGRTMQASDDLTSRTGQTGCLAGTNNGRR